MLFTWTINNDNVNDWINVWLYTWFGRHLWEAVDSGKRKKEFKFLLFYFLSSEISSREVWNGYKYQFNVPEWSQHVLSDTVLALGRHISQILLFGKKESSLSWFKPPCLKSLLLNSSEKMCKCVFMNVWRNGEESNQFIMLTVTGSLPSSLMFEGTPHTEETPLKEV